MAEMNDTGGLNPESGIVNIPDQNAQAAVSGGKPESALLTIPITEAEVGEWWERINESRTARSRVTDEWDLLFKQYIPKVTEGAEDLKSGIHFRNVHSKIPKLFFQHPELVLTPEGPILDPTAIDPATGLPMNADTAGPVFKEVLKKRLGRKGVNSKRLVAECLFDVLTWSGLGCSKIGYKAVSKVIQEPVLQPDPTWQPPTPAPSMLGLAPDPQPPMVPVVDPNTQKPVTRPVTVIIHEEVYWDRFSPKKLLFDTNLTSTRFDKHAGWMGMEFFLPEPVVREAFQIPADVELSAATTNDDLVYQHDNKSSDTKKSLVHGVEIFYKCHIYHKGVDGQPPEKHPHVLYQLVLIEGIKDRAFVHRMSPDQTLDKQGRLTPDSMVGFPYVIFYNRDFADTPWIKADNAFTNSSVKHINTHRQQSVKLRDANIGKFLYDTGAITPDDLMRIKNGTVGEWIGLMDGKLQGGVDKIIAPLVKTESSRDDWRTAEVLKQDVEEMMGISGSGAGVLEDSSRTATEITTAASSRAERMEDEQGRILDTYLDGVDKFATLVQRYTDDTEYVEIVGNNGVRNLQPWNRKLIPFKWAFDAKPDSQLRVDVARDRAQLLQFAKEITPFAQFLNPMPVWKKIATAFHIDWTELAVPLMPPAPTGATPAGPGGAPSTEQVPGAGPGPGAGPIPNAPAPGAGTEEMVRRREQS